MSTKILLEAHDKMHEIVRHTKKVMDWVIEAEQLHSPLTGELLTGWDHMMKEVETIENEIKKCIKSWFSGLDETEYFVIRKTTTYEYDPIMLRSIIPEESEFYIQVKESVNKAEVDKAVKQWVITANIDKALREKSTSISFIDKQKIQDRQEKTVEV